MKINLDSFLPRPDTAAVALTHAEGVPEGERPVPTLITTYTSGDPGLEMSAAAFQVLTGARIEISDNDLGYVGKSDITLTAVHDCTAKDCPSFSARIRFTLSTDLLAPFREELEYRKSFLWICSTTQFEGRATIHCPTSRVVTRSLEERKLH